MLFWSVLPMQKGDIYCWIFTEKMCSFWYYICWGCIPLTLIRRKNQLLCFRWLRRFSEENEELWKFSSQPSFWRKKTVNFYMLITLKPWSDVVVAEARPLNIICFLFSEAELVQLDICKFSLSNIQKCFRYITD